MGIAATRSISGIRVEGRAIGAGRPPLRGARLPTMRRRLVRVPNRRSRALPGKCAIVNQRSQICRCARIHARRYEPFQGGRGTTVAETVSDWPPSAGALDSTRQREPKSRTAHREYALARWSGEYRSSDLGEAGRRPETRCGADLHSIHLTLLPYSCNAEFDQPPRFTNERTPLVNAGLLKPAGR